MIRGSGDESAGIDLLACDECVGARAQLESRWVLGLSASGYAIQEIADRLQTVVGRGDRERGLNTLTRT